MIKIVVCYSFNDCCKSKNLILFTVMFAHMKKRENICCYRLELQPRRKEKNTPTFGALLDSKSVCTLSRKMLYLCDS